MYPVHTCESEIEFLRLCTSLDPYSNMISNEQKSIKVAKLDILQQLKEHKFYFLSWLKEKHLTTEQVDKMLIKIYENVGETEMSTIQRCGGALVEAILQIHVRRFGEAIKAVLKGENLLENCIQMDMIPQEYYNGFKFLVSLLRIHLSVIDGSVIDSDRYNSSKILENGINGFPSLDSDFKPLELAAVLCVRWQLNESFLIRSLKYEDTNSNLLEKMHELDPEYWVWGYVLCSRIRCTRRQQSGTQKYPDIREIEAITSACKYSPEKFLPMCTAGLVQCLAEILRWRTYNSFHEELSVGEMKFLSNDAIAEFIVNTAKEALDEEYVCFGELIRYGEIFSSILPVKYRDIEISHMCLRATILMMPTNSKANHRMGIFQLEHKKNKDLALKFFVRAVKNGEENFPAWLDLIQLLMSDLRDIRNERILEKVFEDVLAGSMKWATADQRASLLFLRAFHYFLKNENKSAIEYWLQYNERDTGISFVSFQGLKGIFKRYSFNLDSNTILENIEKVFNEKIKTCTEGVEKEALQFLIKSVRAAVRVRTNIVATHGEGWRSNTNRSSEPIRIHQQHNRHPLSEADLDDSWRKSPRETQSQLSSSRNSNSSTTFQGGISSTSSSMFGINHSTRHSSSAWQQSRSSSSNNNSFSGSWR